MRKRAACLVAILAVAVSGATLAQAKTSVSKSPAKKSHTIKGTLSTVDISTTGTPGPPINGTAVYVGTADGSVGGAVIAGAARGTTSFTAPSFSGTGTLFGPSGSIKYTLTGTGSVTPTGNVTFSGSGKYTTGTGLYKGAKGTFTFTGVQAKGSPVTTFTTTGSAKY